MPRRILLYNSCWRSFAIVLNPLVTRFIRRGVKRPLAITIVVVVMLIVLTALVGVLAASLNEFIAMLPKYSKELTRKVLHLQELMPFLNLHMSPERMLRGWIPIKSCSSPQH